MYRLKRFLLFSVRDTWVSCLTMLLACLACVLLGWFSDSEHHVPLIFVLAVMLVSRLTSGYFYGVLASLFSVFFVNYVFTYPYFAFNFTIAGYPLTFISMLGVSLVICTLTTRIQMQEAVRLEAEKENMRANLLRAISHDLRTPLTSIIGAMAAVSENMDVLPQEKQIDLLANAQKDASWLVQMVENLLSITRIDDEAAKIEKREEAVEEMIAEVVWKVKKQYPDVSICVNIPEALFFVPMDGILMQQVLFNLLYNAILHGETVTEIALAVTKYEHAAIFTVTDDGVGFAKEKLPYLPRQAHNVLSNITLEESGLRAGIGLSVCHAIIKVHGGTMQAENTDDGGAKVTFSLPLENN